MPAWDMEVLPPREFFWNKDGLVRCRTHRTGQMEPIPDREVGWLYRCARLSGYRGALCIPCESEVRKQEVNQRAIDNHLSPHASS